MQLFPDFGSEGNCSCCERARVSTTKFVEKINLAGDSVDPKRSRGSASISTQKFLASGGYGGPRASRKIFSKIEQKDEKRRTFFLGLTVCLTVPEDLS